MSHTLPFPIPAKIPRRIDPCPIVEAIMEIRFVPTRPWDHFPGLFADKFGAKFPKEEDTGVSQIPQMVRESDPRLTHLPFKRMVGEKFTLQVGPSVVGLVTKRNDYPGWDAFWPAMTEVMAGLSQLGVMREAVRFGLRYINFLSLDVFEQLTLGLAINSKHLRLPETGINTVFFDDPFRHFVQINNATAFPGKDSKVTLGSILDIDTSVTATTTDIFRQAEAFFPRAHVSEKAVFFGLLKSEYVAKHLNPHY